MNLPSRICNSRNAAGRKLSAQAFTIPEVLVAACLGIIFLAAIAVTSMTFMRDFAGMANYTDMDMKSRLAMDQIAKGVRGATDVTGFRTNASPTKYLTVANTNSSITDTFTWDPDDKTLVWDHTGAATRTLLTGCENFQFGFFQRTPGYNYTNIPATDASKIKLISMTWTCKRSILGVKLNSEAVQEARIVIRN